MRRLAYLALLAVTCAMADDLRTGVWRGREVVYRLVDGIPVAEGDILLDNVDADDSSKGRNQAIGRNQSRFNWPDRIVPYVIDADLPAQERITSAIEHWNTLTPMRLVQRTTEADYIRFRRHASACNSFVGRIGREQAINLADSCSLGATIHEIGHAVGLYHEQSRTDRDFHVQVVEENVDKREIGNFNQALTTGEDYGGYDFASIMHYGPTGFSRTGGPVLRTIPAGIPIGQRDTLSPGDIEAVRRMYGAPPETTVITTFPFGLEIEVDGQRVTTPHTVTWEPGTRHTLAAPATQRQGTFRFLFGRWSNEGAAAQTVVASRETGVYIASYVRQYQMPLTVAPAGSGTLRITPEPDEGGWFTDGVEVVIKPVPNEGWNFSQWSGFGAFGTHGLSPDPLRIVVRGPDTRYTANFTRSAVTMITTEPPGLNVVVDGQTVRAPRGFVWSAGTTHTLNVTATSQTTGNDTARHLFEGWSNGGEQSQTISAGDTQTIAARFRTQYRVTRGTVTGGSVTVTPEGDDTWYDAGTALTLRPAPNQGARFLNWTGDLTGADDPGSLIVDDQKVFGASFGTPREILSGGVVNAASFLLTGVTPGGLVTIFGPDIGPDTLVNGRLNAQGRLDTTLGAGYRVTFDEFAAPLVYVSKNQIAAVTPYGIAGRAQTTIRIIGPGWTSRGGVISVIPSSPAIFTANASGRGPAAALNQDGSVNTEQNPAPRGSVVVLYATGEGAVTPAVADGAVPSGATHAPVLPVEARIASRPARVLYAGAAPGIVSGVMQVNVELPDDIAPGAVPVSIRVGTAASPGNVSVWVR